jgi:pyruvate dehydrogenase E2 component (dihydrolipoamide acetyltransferase)
MKKIALIAALTLAVPAWAQQAKPPAEPAKPASAAVAPEAPKAEAPKAEASKPEAAKAETPKAQAKAKAPRKPGTHRQEDARHCLEKGSNTEIIKCAEAYL